MNFDKLVKEAKKDPNIIGLFLTGSRGKGIPTKYSDYDVVIIVKGNVIKKYKRKYKSKGIFDFLVFSLSEFRRYAEIGTPFEWDRPSFTHVKAIVDKTDKIQKLIDKKGRIPKNKIKKYVSGYLDGYINAVYRSLKCFRDNNKLCGRLEAARSIGFFLKIVFGLEGRVPPFPKYLKWELKNYPLKKFPMKSKEMIKIILKILNSGDVKSQQKLFKLVENVFKKEGYSKVFDNWNPNSIAFIKSYKNKYK